MRYSDIIGQEDSVARLRAFSDFYLKHGSTTGHILIVADEGMGKRAVAVALSEELGVPLQEVSASGLEIVGDLTAVLTNLRQNELLLIRGFHRLRRTVQDTLLVAMRTHELTITLGQGASARRHALELKPFTVVGTAPKKSDCADELLGCFTLVLPLEAYTNSALEKIGERIAAQEKIEIDALAIRLLAARCRSRPGNLKMLMQRVAKAINNPRITEQDAQQALVAFGMTVHSDDRTADFTSLGQMSGVEFEKLVTVLLARMEFRPEMTRATGDGGIDIVAVLNKPILGGKYLFQCKRYGPENLVGASAVRDFYGAVTADKAVKGILITTSDFTAQAREFAKRVGLELINLPQLQNLLAQHGMASG